MKRDYIIQIIKEEGVFEIVDFLWFTLLESNYNDDVEYVDTHFAFNIDEDNGELYCERINTIENDCNYKINMNFLEDNKLDTDFNLLKEILYTVSYHEYSKKGLNREIIRFYDENKNNVNNEILNILIMNENNMLKKQIEDMQSN